MTKVLSLNSGSSSLKMSIFDFSKNCEELSSVHIDGIGNKNCVLKLKSKKYNIDLKLSLEIINHNEAFQVGLFSFTEVEIIETLTEIKLIGHRIVHGGEYYNKATLIDKVVEKRIKQLIPLAPLHNTINLESYIIAKTYFKKIPHIAIFDTAFHQSLNKEKYLYPIPKIFYEKHKIRRYGFHGINHAYINNYVLKKLKKENLKIISCHLGNGSSICASINGKSIDTSMGFTPLEGIIMGTRSGSIDPGIIIYLLNELKIDKEKAYKILNEESGLKALSEISHDMREIYGASIAKDEKAIMTIEMLATSIAKTIGSYLTVLNGVDAIVFTGGLGEKAFYVREKVIEKLTFAGIKIDKEKNKKNEEEIHTKDSKSKIFIIQSAEEKEIALEAYKFAKEKKLIKED